MKRLYIVLTVVLSSFLLLLGREVKADEITINISDDFISFMDNNLSTLISIAENKLLEDSNFVDYFIFYNPNFIDNRRVKIFYFTTINGVNSFRYYNSNFHSTGYPNNNTLICYYSEELVLSSCSTNNNRIDGQPLYASFELSFNFYDGDYTYNFMNGDFSYLLINDVVNHFPTIYELKNYWYAESDTVDNTPILTNFYTTVIEKINYLCGVIVGNYVYMSIFVIFILIILIELIFRRRL